MAEFDLDKIAAVWAQRGFSCDLWVDPAGQLWENFAHDVDEIVMVIEGEMEFHVGGKLHHLQAGDELLIPARVVHSSLNIGTSIARWLYGFRVLDS